MKIDLERILYNIRSPYIISRIMDEEDCHCGICGELFYLPATIGCGHTFCRECLEDLVRHKGKQCPECRQSFRDIPNVSILIQNIISKFPGYELKASERRMLKDYEELISDKLIIQQFMCIQIKNSKKLIKMDDIKFMTLNNSVYENPYYYELLRDDHNRFIEIKNTKYIYHKDNTIPIILRIWGKEDDFGDDIKKEMLSNIDNTKTFIKVSDSKYPSSNTEYKDLIRSLNVISSNIQDITYGCFGKYKEDDEDENNQEVQNNETNQEDESEVDENDQEVELNNGNNENNQEGENEESEVDDEMPALEDMRDVVDRVDHVNQELSRLLEYPGDDEGDEENENGNEVEIQHNENIVLRGTPMITPNNENEAIRLIAREGFVDAVPNTDRAASSTDNSTSSNPTNQSSNQATQSQQEHIQSLNESVPSYTIIDEMPNTPASLLYDADMSVWDATGVNTIEGQMMEMAIQNSMFESVV